VCMGLGLGLGMGVGGASVAVGPVSVVSIGSADGVGVSVAVVILVGVCVGISGSGVLVGGTAVGWRVGGLVAFCARCFSIAGRPMPNNTARMSRALAPTIKSPIQDNGLLLGMPSPHD